MFNFLFEGKLGEMLAPSLQSPLMTAIMRNDQDAIQNLVAGSSTMDICRNDESGYSAVHAACRYNNLFALQLIFSRGVHVEQPDRNGSTPLHYASKYGHLELCKHLVERGAYPARRNNFNQTPYDLAESHTVRQYLLPLQLSAERGEDNPSTAGYSATSYSANAGMVYSSSRPVPPEMAMTGAPSAPGTYPVSPVLGRDASYPPPHTGVDLQHAVPSPSAAYQPPVFTHQTAQNKTTQPVKQDIKTIIPGMPHSLSSCCLIAPLDGFGSSASDPVLQAKYGHVKEVINIAPPPIMSAPTPIQYSAFNSGSSTMYNRYVPYDVNAPSAPQPSYPHYNPSPVSSHPAPQQSSVPPPVPQGVSQPPSQHAPLLSQPVPPPPVLTSSNSFGSNFITPAVVQTNFPKAASPREGQSSTSQPTPDSTLVQVDLSSPESRMTAQRSSSFEAEEQVISSSSSSVL